MPPGTLHAMSLRSERRVFLRGLALDGEAPAERGGHRHRRTSRRLLNHEPESLRPSRTRCTQASTAP